MPVYCTGVGKVLLSGLSNSDFNKIMRKQKFIKYTDNTITDPEELKEELEKIRDRGYATDNQEYMEGLRCVAVPIFNHRGRITCAMSIAGPVSRMRGQEFDLKKAHLLEAAHEISKQMGYGSWHN
jgi:DNA-binding IclR family transcriptional regulator